MKPNIFLIVVDSLRYDHVGSQDGKPSLTPNLDSLSQRAIVFDQAISQGPSTRVSMSSMMSSTYASLYGGQLKLAPNRPVIQDMLKHGGYQSAGITSNLYLSRSFGWSRDFDFYDDCRPEATYHRKFFMRALNQVTKRFGFPLSWPKSLPAKYVFENANNILKSIREPFFMWIHLMDVHWPYSIQDFSWSRKRVTKRKEENELRPRLVSIPPEITPEEHDQLYTEYREAIQYTDDQIGTFLHHLDINGILDSSWIFITADHGEEFKEHGQYFHHPTLFDELIHVPLIVMPPEGNNITGNWNYSGQVRLIDLPPTFSDIAQINGSTASSVSGESLLPIIKKESINEHRSAIVESPGNLTLAYRNKDWKLIWNTKSDDLLLFNLSKDPGEFDNLFTQEEVIGSELHGYLKKHISMIEEERKSSDESEADFDLDPLMIEQLKDLGYLE